MSGLLELQYALIMTMRENNILQADYKFNI